MTRPGYLLFRAILRLLGVFSIETAFRLGHLLGTLVYLTFWPYRKLVIANLTIAFGGFGGEKSRGEIRTLARRHFQNLLANLLVIPRLNQLSRADILQHVSFEGLEVVGDILKAGRGTVWVGNHMGPWELIPQTMFLFEDYRRSSIYQRIANPSIESYVTKIRGRFGLEMLERKEGIMEAMKILRQGGIVGILIDQHAGDAGTWTPFFGRLASTTPLAALMAARSGAALISLAVQTVGVARWKMTFELGPPAGKHSLDSNTAELNQILERQIRRSPHEWFWVHDRWKTPSPEFLLANRKRYRRGVVLPEGMSESDLKHFRLVVRSSNWLGDAVMTVPAVRAMKHGRPDLHLTMLCQEKLAGLWKLIPEVDEIIAIRSGESIFAVAKKLRGKFDAAVILPNSMRSVLEMRAAGIPRRAGYDRQGRRFLLDQIIRDPKKAGPPEHQSQHYLRIAETVGADLTFATFPTLTRHKPYAPLRLGLCPGAEYGSAKRWLPERFAAVGQAVAQRRHCEWLIFGTAADEELAATIASQIGPSAKNLAGQTTLAELIDALGQCSALLTNDTGTMHLAALLGVPTISIFGSTEPVLTGPMGPNHRVIRHQVECSPCFLRDCPIDFRCMHAVQVDEVIEAVLKTLDA